MHSSPEIVYSLRARIEDRGDQFGKHLKGARRQRGDREMGRDWKERVKQEYVRDMYCVCNSHSDVETREK